MEIVALAAGNVPVTLRVPKSVGEGYRTFPVPVALGIWAGRRWPLAAPREVLVVDDSTAVRLLIRGMAEAHGYVVREAVDGVEAVRSRVSHWRIPDVLDTAQLLEAVGQLEQRLGRADRLIGAYEQLQVPLAEVRERRGIAGMPAEAARNFRDKARMKSLLREAGLPCARHRLVTGPADAMAFAGEIGFPLVVKPPAGAGALATTKADDVNALRTAVDAATPALDRPVLLEEYVTGDEHSFETVSIDGRAVWHSLTRARIQSLRRSPVARKRPAPSLI